MNKSGLSYLSLAGLGVAAVAAALVSADQRGPKRPGGGGSDYVNSSFVNWETGQVHPVDMTPDGTRLLVCNTADARLEVFDLSTGTPTLLAEIPVGLDPISVRARSNTEAWVVNNISDSVSVVSLVNRNVVATLKCKDEPSDVVFAGTPQKAFVTCSQPNLIEVFDPANLAAAPTDVSINGKNPRALTVSPDGQTVYAAIFNSGNASTILGGGATGVGTLSFPPNSVNDANGPHGGANPFPNAGAAFDPPLGAAGIGPRVGLIVKKSGNTPASPWLDDTGADWSGKVHGANAADSGRVVGWDMPDRDLAVVSTSSLVVTYARSLMNICMGTAVNPATGQISVIGTDAINEKRFEPQVKGRFVHVTVALVNPVGLTATIKDLNPHLLPYTAQQVAQSERDKSIGDPRGIAWNAAGTKAYVSGMGSNNVVVINASGDRAGLAQTINVGQGPTGVAFDAGRNQVYVLNRFDGTVSVINAATETVSNTVGFFDPTPAAIKIGRKHLYDTHKTSGLGQAACGSCHVDGRMDFLAWDLGDPSGTIKQLTGQNLGANIPGLGINPNPAFGPWHPMKGPMTTQTLQDIIGKEPHHWRGDRAGLEEFNPAFQSLLGDDVSLTTTEMQEFEDFLATITYPPNPFRNMDNTLPATLPLPGHYTSARFGPAGLPLPDGHPGNGLALYTNTVPGQTRLLDNNAFACVTCHTLPTGAGTDTTLTLATQTYAPLAVGPQGQHHLMLVSTDGSTNLAIKTPQFRNAYLKVGFETTQLENNQGFGFVHDGSVDSLARFVSEPIFTVQSDQEVADLVSFILCVTGSDLPPGGTNVFTPPGVASNDSHAAVGVQTTLVDQATASAAQLNLISSIIVLAQSGKVGLVVKGVVSGEQRGFMWTPVGFQSDRQSQLLNMVQLQGLAHAGSELTYTVVPAGSQNRIGVDRDQNGVFDRDQADLACYANCDGSHAPPILNANDFQCFLNIFAAANAYANCDGSTAPPVLNANDFQCFLNKFAAGCP